MINDLTASLSARSSLPSKPPESEPMVQRLAEIAATKPTDESTNKETPRLAEQSVDLTREELTEAVESLNQHVQSVRRELRFELDEASGRTVIHVIDSETEEVIRDIPPESARALAAHFDQLQGVLLQEKA